jgi:hypothetical protein
MLVAHPSGMADAVEEFEDVNGDLAAFRIPPGDETLSVAAPIPKPWPVARFVLQIRVAVQPPDIGTPSFRCS